MFMAPLKRTIFVFMALLQDFLCVHGPITLHRAFFVFVVLL